MKCKSCGEDLAGVRGNLIRLSPKTLNELYSSELYQQIASKFQGKHIVLCPDCIRKALKRNLVINDLDFKSNKGFLYWYTINLQFFLHLKGIDPNLVIRTEECTKCVSLVSIQSTHNFINKLTE